MKTTLSNIKQLAYNLGATDVRYLCEREAYRLSDKTTDICYSCGSYGISAKLMKNIETNEIYVCYRTQNIFIF